MDSMADLMRKLGWIAWCLTVIGWFLSPVITWWLVNKIFGYLEFDASKKLKELENDTIPKLKQMLSAVEKTVLRPAEDQVSQSDLKILESMKMDLKSALYEAEDILDLLDYRHIEKRLWDDDSVWVENQLSAGRAWIASCKCCLLQVYFLIEMCVLIWLDCLITVYTAGAAVLQRVQSWCQQLQQRSWCQRFGSAVLQRVQSWCQQLKQRLSAVVQRVQSWCQHLQQRFWSSSVLQWAQSWCQRFGRSAPLLPFSRPVPQPPCLQSRGSVFAPADATRRTAGEMVDEEQIVDETQVAVEGEAEIEEELGEMENREVGEASDEEIEDDNKGKERSGALLPVSGPAPQPPCFEFESRGSEFVAADSTRMPAEEMVDEEKIVEEPQVTPEEEIQEDDEEGKEEPPSLSILWYCARTMLTWYAKFCGIVRIITDKMDASAITQRISLRNQIQRIEHSLKMAKDSDLLKDKNSSNGTTKDTDKESSSKQREIDELSRAIRREVLGRDKDRADIILMLREGRMQQSTYGASPSTIKPYSVIGIYGITGSGKTTLAQYVFDYEKKAGHFKPIMFIHVGKTFSVGDIFRDMMEQITQSRPPNHEDLKILYTKLKETLKEKRFLLVLDDLWVNNNNPKELDILIEMLRVAGTGSRVLVTAQTTDAAGALGAYVQPFPIPDLEEEAYLSLLMHHAGPFATDDEYRKYEMIGIKIANRLSRSPIAAVTVGKQLQRNKSINFWKTTAGLHELKETMGALWWSYQQLGVDTRRCFAYCSTFPRGHRLTREELVRIWIAQGFVKTKSATEELEDVGQRYFHELLTFSFLQGPRIEYVEPTETFTIHDLLHELAERVSGSDFFRIGMNESPVDIPQGVHHLYIEATNGVEIAEKLVKTENLRTLIITEWLDYTESLNFNTGIRHDNEKLLKRLFMRLTKLRVLIIDSSSQKLSVPSCIDQMKHLRYLGLHTHTTFSPVLILPSTFSKLYHIEIIDIPCDRAEFINRLSLLWHIPRFPNIGRLTSLRTMEPPFMVKGGQGYGLKQLKHVNKLGGTLIIEGLEIVGSKEEALEAQLSRKERLRELSLNFSSWKKRRFGPDVEAEVLEGLCPPKHLEELHIGKYRGSRYPSWMLSCQHPDGPKKLHKLELWDCSQLACIPKDSEFMIGLCELKISQCDWDRLPENMECLVSLQTLGIYQCDKILLLPTLPRQSLTRITIRYCRMLSASCQDKGHDNWKEIKHVPTIDIVE